MCLKSQRPEGLRPDATGEAGMLSTLRQIARWGPAAWPAPRRKNYSPHIAVAGVYILGFLPIAPRRSDRGSVCRFGTYAAAKNFRISAFLFFAPLKLRAKSTLPFLFRSPQTAAAAGLAQPGHSGLVLHFATNCYNSNHRRGLLRSGDGLARATPKKLSPSKYVGWSLHFSISRDLHAQPRSRQFPAVAADATILHNLKILADSLRC